jgi:Zn-dependent protease with chaperone function
LRQTQQARDPRLRNEPVKRAEVRRLVRLLEREQQQDPAAFKVRVAGIVALGYVYLLGLMGLLSAAVALPPLVFPRTAGRWTVQIGLMVAVCFWIILRALYVPLSAPRGLRVQANEAPRLFEAIREIHRRLRAPAPKRVLLSLDMNASMTQVPLLGVLGWHRGYLLLGMPLMAGISPDHFRAVLAHEFGHFSRNHGRFSGWVYRIRETWWRVAVQMESHDGWERALFLPFLRWYAPRLTAYAFVLSRMHEYESDRCAAEITSARVAGEALVQVAVQTHRLEEAFWPEIQRLVPRQPAPPEQIVRLISESMRSANWKLTEWLRRSLAQKTDYGDTHPCLKDRLAVLGMFNPGPPDPPQVTAAEFFLDSSLATLGERLSQEWKESNEAPWRDAHSDAAKMASDLQELEGKAARQSLTAEELWNRAAWTHQIHGPDAAQPFLLELLQHSPEHAPARYLIGKSMLQNGQDEGLAHLEFAMKANRHYALEVCDLSVHFLRLHGRDQEALRYVALFDDYADRLDTDAQERGQVHPCDVFLPHALDTANIEKITTLLTTTAGVRRAYLARKKVTAFPDVPFYVLVIGTQLPWYQPDFKFETREQKIIEEVASRVTFPGEGIVLPLNQDTQGIGKKIRKLAGSRLM